MSNMDFYGYQRDVAQILVEIVRNFRPLLLINLAMLLYYLYWRLWQNNSFSKILRRKQKAFRFYRKKEVRRVRKFTEVKLSATAKVKNNSCHKNGQVFSIGFNKIK